MPLYLLIERFDVIVSVRLVTIALVIVLLAGVFWLLSPNRSKNNIPQGITGEVSITAPPGVSRVLPANQVPPSFFITRANKTLTLGDLKGKYIFLSFWNTWCPPCRAEIPDLNRLYLQYRDKNVEFLFINITAWEKSEAEVTDFLQRENLQLPVYLDRRAEVAASYGVRSIPTTIVIKPDGRVVYAGAGQLTYEKAELLLQ